MSIKTDTSDGKWQFWIDRGGTFTDIVAKSPDGSLNNMKYLSENPEQYKDAAIQGCLLYTSPSPRDATLSRMPSSA